MISPKKKLLLVHSSNDLYGASKIFMQLIDLLTKNGFDIHVILPEKGMLDDFLIKKDYTKNNQVCFMLILFIPNRLSL